MNFDSLILASVSGELKKRILFSKVERVIQPSPSLIVIQLYLDGKKESLLISVDARFARIHLTDRSFSSKGAPPPFCMQLRKHLTGARLVDVDRLYGLSERQISLGFSRSDEEMDWLHIEIMGKHSNIILANSENMILGAIKLISARQSRVRQIRPGIVYAPPPEQNPGRLNPYENGADNLSAGIEFESKSDAKNWLLSSFSGVSPMMALETIARSESEALRSDVLAKNLIGMIRQVESGGEAAVRFQASGSEPGAYPVRLKSVPEAVQMRWRSICAALDDAFASAEASREFADRSGSLIASLLRRLKQIDRERGSVGDGLAASERADSCRETGDLLLASPNAEIRDGLIVLPDFFSSEPDAVREVEAVPGLSLRELAEKYYRKAKKARDSKVFLEARLASLNGEYENVSNWLVKAEAAATIDEIGLLEIEIAKQGIFRTVSQAPEPGKTRDQEPQFDGHKIRRFHSPDGWEILVGENATSNDYLTTKIASPNDIWLHARSVTSAHAIVRTQNRPSAVSAQAIRFAAELVAKRSDAKHSGIVAVDYALKKYVRKPRKSPPGTVIYSGEKTIDVSTSDD